MPGSESPGSSLAEPESVEPVTWSFVGAISPVSPPRFGPTSDIEPPDDDVSGRRGASAPDSDASPDLVAFDPPPGVPPLFCPPPPACPPPLV
ncbi:MAG: hypothetical protein ABW212_02745, partial [Pseudonocardia sediminis]